MHGICITEQSLDGTDLWNSLPFVLLGAALVA